MAKTKPEETKRQKFVRLATARTDKALTAIRRLEPLANSRDYDFKREDVDKIHVALSDHIDKMRERFDIALTGGSASAPSSFSLEDESNE